MGVLPQSPSGLGHRSVNNAVGLEWISDAEPFCWMREIMPASRDFLETDVSA
jgi:hypothetical protein